MQSLLFSRRFVWIPLVLTLFFVGCGGETDAPKINFRPIPAFPGNVPPPLLIDAAQLDLELRSSEPKPVVIDLSPPRTYRSAHLPSAIHGWWQDTMEWNSTVYGTLLGPEDDRESRLNLLEDLGINESSRVVVYDNERGLRAARMVWFLRFVGVHQAAALDGGLASWRAHSGRVENGTNAAPDVGRSTLTPQVGWSLNTPQLQRRMTDPATLLVDVRTDAEARDTANGTLKPGRIPGSISFPWTSTLADDAGRLKTPVELAAALTAAGVTPERHIVLYARYGVESDQLWLVLSLMGFHDVAIYDAGWAGWIANPDRAVAPL